MLQVYLEKVREEIEYLLAYIDDIEEMEAFLGAKFIHDLQYLSVRCSELINELDFK